MKYIKRYVNVETKIIKEKNFNIVIIENTELYFK